MIMDRKAVARETIEIMRQGFYELTVGTAAGAGQEAERKRIDISRELEWSVKNSFLITPEQGELLLEKYEAGKTDEIPVGNGETGTDVRMPEQSVENCATVDAIRSLAARGRTKIGVLNFASAKNPGGGFLNGAMAQEESLAASGTLYRTLISHEEYYRESRAHRSMMYLDYGIYSPGVTFFRDGSFRLTEEPVKASVLTLPAVNMGQVLLKGEDPGEAKRRMRRRMKLALAVFAEQKETDLVLGAYGCGVFRNDPREVADWWEELLEEGMGRYFDSVVYAVLDRSRGQECICAFRERIAI